MKFLKLLLLGGLFVFISNNTTAQDYNKWSIDLGAGIHTIGVPLSPGYKASPLGQGNVGVRYMLNNKFGLRFDIGFRANSMNQKEHLLLMPIITELLWKEL